MSDVQNQLDAHAIVALVAFRLRGVIGDSDATTTLGARWKEQRQCLGFKSPNALAHATGLSHVTLKRIEDNTSSPGGETLRTFASAGADIQYVLTGKRALSVALVERVVGEAITFWREAADGRE